jgi:hypothetical protein
MTANDLQVGIIEGFYGTQWSWAERAACAPFLKSIGMGFYIYAPKGAPYFRRQWRDALPEPDLEQLATTSNVCKQNRVAFGIGFSPLEIYVDYGADEQRALRAKIDQLNLIGIDMFCVLFDDMRGDLPNIAQQQADIVHTIADASNASQFLMCPTYYSTDPVLERLFGKMPLNYLEDLGRGLDPSIEIFWTGPRVVSTNYPDDHLRNTADALGRKPFLWDNYPVNDSAKMSNHLHLRAFEGRPSTLREFVSGHAVNPMNQPHLSRIPLRTLALSYAQGASYDGARAFARSCQTECPDDLASVIQEDLETLHDDGLTKIDENTKSALVKKYERWPDSPHASEIIAWLRGDYEFDPACLTD